MNLETLFSRISGVLLIAFLAYPLTVLAGGALPFSDLELPESSAQFSATQQCVEPEDEMKVNHMNYILHQRDATVYEGIRTRQYALEECINCHASKDANGEYIRVEDSRHFCAACHIYTATNIDCFQCHADVPVRASSMPNLQSSNAPHHKQAVQKSPLSSKTLQLLAAEVKPQ